MIKEIILLVCGLAGLWIGSGIVVEAAKKLALKYKISHTLIGLTVISIGTSLPEIFTNIFSGFKNIKGIEASGIAVGTNIGSCLTQITLILGIVALLGTIKTNKKIIYRDGGMVLLAIILMFIAGLNGKVSRVEGFSLVLIYLIYLAYITKDSKAMKNILSEFRHHDPNTAYISVLNNSFMVFFGLAILSLATSFVVNNAIKIATSLDIAQSFIGVMIVGVGSGLPELSTAVRGVFRRAYGISLGTLVGSNVTDPLFSLGLGAIVAGFNFDSKLLWFDVPYWFVVTLIALFLLRRTLSIGKNDRKEGLILIGLYLIFLIVKIRFFT